jgi:hypothetical protein
VPSGKQQTDLDGRHPRAQINGAHGIRSPPAFLPLSGGGGGGGGGSGIWGAPLQRSRSKRPDQWREAIPDPPRLSTFKRRWGGGGGPESRAHLSDG